MENGSIRPLVVPETPSPIDKQFETVDYVHEATPNIVQIRTFGAYRQMCEIG